ncbi:MAG: hypothetical protein IPK33_33330 [Gemmatimonadetes bacterium]|nr:hypothetical protein [Gemmatimonadota bacterium]
MGHTEATFAEPLFLRHLLGGIRHAMGSGRWTIGARAPRRIDSAGRARGEAQRADRDGGPA